MTGYQKGVGLYFHTGVVPVSEYNIQEYNAQGDGHYTATGIYHPFGFAINDNNRILVNNELIYKEGRYL